MKKDSYINFLIRLNQKDPSQLTEGQKNYLAVELHKKSQDRGMFLYLIYITGIFLKKSKEMTLR
ncbi:hypothetical protein INQ00_02750 [Haemophilus parainfluenzae]|nr:hypothetical protein INQ00_02750 [Haemophilus parainfluenzae]